MSRGRTHGGVVAILSADVRSRGEPPTGGSGGQRSAGSVRLPGTKRGRRGDRQGGQVPGAVAAAGAEPVSFFVRKEQACILGGDVCFERTRVHLKLHTRIWTCKRV